MLTADGEEIHATQHHDFPLPAPHGFQPTFSAGRYRLPHPVTGVPTSFTRASTVAKVLDDTYYLERWKQRRLIYGLSQSSRLKAMALSAEVTDVGKLNYVADQSLIQGGAHEWAERGTSVHEWTEVVDRNDIFPHQVPDALRPAVNQYILTCAEAGIQAAPGLNERIVYNSHSNTVGTLDRGYFLADGTLVLGDLKTSKVYDEHGELRGLWDSVWVSWGIQLAQYHGAEWMLSEDGNFWIPAPRWLAEYAVVVHIPSDAPDQARVIPFNMEKCKRLLDLALAVRNVRKTARDQVPFTDPLPKPSPKQARFNAAVAAIVTSSSAASVAAVWGEYQDIWTDDLTALGDRVIESISQVKAKVHV